MMKRNTKRIRYPNALLAAARSVALRQRVVPDKTQYRRVSKRSWLDKAE